MDFSNSTTNLSQRCVAFADGALSPGRLFISLFFLATFLVGLVGNALVLGVAMTVNKDKRKVSVSNIYIFNLALADLLFACTLPAFCWNSWTGDWPFGSIACKAAKAFYETNRYSSVLLLIALTIDRYLATFPGPLDRFRSLHFGKIVCVVIWIICVVIAIPILIYAEAREVGGGMHQCVFGQLRTNFYLFASWTSAQLVFGLIIPSVVMVTAYNRLLHRLHTMRGVRSDHFRRPNPFLTRTIVFAVVAFLITNIPDNIGKLWTLIWAPVFVSPTICPSTAEVRFFLLFSHF